MSKNDLNTCYYSKGSQHDLCTHKQWCIFQKERIITEQQITNLTKRHDTLEKQYTHQLVRGGGSMINKEELTAIKEDIKRLREYMADMIK